MVGRARATGLQCRDVFVQVCQRQVGPCWNALAEGSDAQPEKLQALSFAEPAQSRARCIGDDVSTAKSIAIGKACI